MGVGEIAAQTLGGCGMEKWFPVETARLLLREFRASDEADIHEYARDPQVSQWMEWGPNTPEMTRQVLALWLKTQAQWPRPKVELAVQLKAESKVIGGIRLEIRDERIQTADFGYALRREYWGRGYATEAGRAILKVAFAVLQMHRVWAICDQRNRASYRVMEKLGMRREGEFKKDVWRKGDWRDSYLYAILAEEWTSRG